MSQDLKQEQLVRDLQQLAGEIYPLIRKGANAAQRHQAVELAETAWHKLRDIGPIHNGDCGYYRALDGGQIECLSYDSVEGALPGVVLSAIDITHRRAWGLWFSLVEAWPCTEALYADVKTMTQLAEGKDSKAIERAQERWNSAELELLAEGLLPVRCLAPPSAAGGARYVFETYVGHELLPALRETLAEWGGYIIGHRPDVSRNAHVYGGSYYTLSLEKVNDQWLIAKQMVFQYYADKSDG